MSARDGCAGDENESVVARLPETLPDREREMVRLRLDEETSQPGIAEFVGLSRRRLAT